MDASHFAARCSNIFHSVLGTEISAFGSNLSWFLFGEVELSSDHWKCLGFIAAGAWNLLGNICEGDSAQRPMFGSGYSWLQRWSCRLFDACSYLTPASHHLISKDFKTSFTKSPRILAPWNSSIVLPFSSVEGGLPWSHLASQSRHQDHCDQVFTTNARNAGERY